MTPPDWILRSLRWLTIGVLAVFATAGVFVAVVMPYRFWDSLAFGAWSRSIAEEGSLWAGSDVLSVSRPLFYVPQGLLWRLVAEEEWLGRLLSLGFAALLVAAVWQLARQVSGESRARPFLAPLAVGVLLSSAVLATYAAAGMTDVPVAAASAATAVALWSSLPPGWLIGLSAAGAAATVLAKPSGLLALTGIALATVVLRRRAAISGLVGVGIGTLVAVAYDAWHAARAGVPLADLLRAGNDDFWLERGAAVRWEVFASAGWLGGGARLLLLYGLAYATARVAGAGSRVSLAVGAGVAFVWSIAGPLAAGQGLGYPLDGSFLGIVGLLAVCATMAAAPFLAAEDPLQRRTYAALLVWLAPIGVVWASQRPDETRLLAPAWPAFALLSAAALTVASLSLLRRRATLGIAPTAAVALVALTNVGSVDGLGRDGWRQLLDLGPSGWRDGSVLENFAYGPFSYHLDLARENVDDDERIVSSDGRLKYFFPGRVEVSYARTCGELEGARFFSFLTSGESLEQAALGSQPTNPLGWLQCTEPRLELIGEHEGIYAAFVVGSPPARRSTPEDCRLAATPGQLLDAIFGQGLRYAEAARLHARALEVGFVGSRLERTGCSTFRVVVTGVPDDRAVQADFARQAEGVGLPVEYSGAVRYPEVPSDVAPVAAR